MSKGIYISVSELQILLISNQCLSFAGLQRFTKAFWENTPVVKVDSLPFDINGKCVYQVPYQKDKRMKAAVDEHPWDRDMSVKWKGAEMGSVRAQRCKGSYKCENQNVLSSSNMAKPIPSSLRKIETVTWSVKVLEDAPSLFLV